ncbi:MAG: hypothetical protein HDS16_04920 [Bacteroides sp.]|nr:hypothetical protein [Bacteroides sp.]
MKKSIKKNNMPTPEEIKKIAREYAEYCCRETDYEGDIVERNMDLHICADEVAMPLLEWLSKDYCIVPKTLLKELYDCYKQHESVSKEKGLYESEMIARGSQATMRDIFGKSLLEKEKL